MHLLKSFRLLVLLALSCFAAAACIESPELIPGPGLPSLASLNLTTADLRELPLPEISADQPIVGNPKCGPDDYAYTKVTNLIICFHYMIRLGTTPCDFKRYQVTTLCRYGGSGVYGTGFGRVIESSYCSDVALGLLTVINGCTRPDESVAGFAAANGNGNIIVGGTNVEYVTH